MVYSHDLRQKKRAIWMWLAEHYEKGQEREAASTVIVTRPNGMDFS